MTKRMNVEEIDSRSRDGAYLHGLYMEGAKWAPNDGAITKATPREMFCQMPIINCRSIASDKASTSNIYQCPVYKTLQRGPTFVFVAQLKTKSPPARWTLAGVALVMDIVS